MLRFGTDPSVKTGLGQMGELVRTARVFKSPKIRETFTNRPILPRFGGQEVRIRGTRPSPRMPTASSFQLLVQGLSIGAQGEPQALQSELKVASGSPYRVGSIGSVLGAKLPARMMSSGLFQGPNYPSLIRQLVEKDRISAARSMLALALSEIPNDKLLRRLNSVLAPPTISLSPSTDEDRSAEYSWLSAHAAAFAGKWVALQGGTLIHASHSLTELRKELKSMGLTKSPLVTRIR